MFIDESGFVRVQLLFDLLGFNSFHSSNCKIDCCVMLIGPWTSGRNLIEKSAVVKQFRQPWGLGITAIPVLCTDGIIDLGIYDWNVNAATFQNFVRDKFCFDPLPFNGINPPYESCEFLSFSFKTHRQMFAVFFSILLVGPSKINLGTTHITFPSCL